METVKVQAIKIENVTRTYRGKTGCACSCGGVYADPGTKAGKMRVNFINKNLSLVKVDHWKGESCYEIESEDGTRVTRVYIGNEVQ